MRSRRGRALALVAGVLVFACSGTTGPGAGSPSPSASSNLTSPSPSRVSVPAMSFRTLPYVATNGTISPDGRYVTRVNRDTGSGPSLDLLRADGSFVSGQPVAGRTEWLSDSSGIFIEMDAPQRAGPLGIIELDGTLTVTELQMAQPMLSRDGRTVVAAHQEGCCVAISIREVRASARTGGKARSLVLSATAPDVLQPIYLFGIDQADRLIYRDGPTLWAVAVSGGRPASLTVPDGLDPTKLLADGVSPDGRAMVLHTVRHLSTGMVELERRWILVDGVVDAWPQDAGEPLLLAALAGRAQPRGILWSGDHSLLVRTADGSITPYDLSARKAASFRAPVPREASALAYANGSLLWADGPRVHVTEVATGRDRDTGLRVDGDPLAIAARGAVGGGFIVLTPSASYLVE